MQYTMTALAHTTDYVSPYCPNDNTQLSVDPNGIHALLDERDAARAAILTLTEAAQGQALALRALGKTQYVKTRTEFNGMIGSTASLLFSQPEQAIRHLDAEFWERAVALAAISDCMSGQRKAHWRTAIEELDFPPFEADNVLPTLHDLLHLRSSHFAERVDALFHALSPDHVTNSPAAFGKRMIIKGNELSGGTTQAQIDALDDLRVLVAILLRRAPLSTSSAGTKALLNSIERDGLLGQWLGIDQSAIRIKVFKVGTLHIEIHPDVVFQLNDILAMRYPMSIPERFRRAPSKPNKTFPEPVQDALPLDVLAELADIRRIMTRSDIEYRRNYPDHAVIYDFVNTQISDKSIAIMEALGATRIDSVAWQCDFDLRPVIRTIVRIGGLPDKQSHQYYPSKGDVGEQAAQILNSHLDDEAKVLEPSAGRGHLAAHVASDNLHLVELSAVNCAILRASGFKSVHEGDFLTYAKQQSAQFDGVLMNPPFADGRARAHVEAALTTLREGGVCVAIVPASLAISDFITDGISGSQTEAFHGAFDDANVSVRILTLHLA
jgi:16S rRNA G966 N2-methylase RsmD